jgi:D-alanyl-D-alanine carboxypeptidase (penicillin-binding protein 5/6)
MNYKYFLKNIFIFCVCVLVFGWGLQWFFNGLIDFSEWKISQNKDAFLGSVSDNTVRAQGEYAAKAQVPYRDWQIEDLKIDSEAAISVEADLVSPDNYDKILFKKNEQEKLTPASLVKLMTSIISLENYELSEKIAISKTTTMKEDEQGFLIATDSMSVKDLLYIMLIESNNHAAYSLSQALGEKSFVDLMNDKAKSLGLESTYFVDSTGLSPENYSTAEDLAKLAKYLLKNYPLIADISKIKEFDLYSEDGSLYKKLVNTNKLLSEIPESVGGKTGFTEEAKECLLLVVRNSKENSYLINVVLGSDDRFLEMKNIIDWVESAYVW